MMVMGGNNLDMVGLIVIVMGFWVVVNLDLGLMKKVRMKIDC